MSTTVAVTGAAGHIGNVVCRELLKRGYRVKALCRSGSKSLDGLPVELVHGDVLDKIALARLMQDCTIVIHCAAIISLNGDPSGIVFKTNTEGPVNVLDVAESLGVKRMIHLSSVHASVEEPMHAIFDENRPYKTASAYVYDYSKARGEQLLLDRSQSSRVELVILRPSSVVGPFDFKPSELGKALIDFYEQRIPVLPAGGYDFVDVRDVAQSIVSAIDRGKNGEIYLLSGKYYSMKEFAKAVRRVTGKWVPSLQIPIWLLKLSLPLVALYSRITGAAPLFTMESITALHKGHRRMDHSKADRDLGHRCRDLEESIRDFCAWRNDPQNRTLTLK